MKKYLVIGNPIEHSLSPKLHNHWFKKNNINAIYNKKQNSFCCKIAINLNDLDNYNIKNPSSPMTPQKEKLEKNIWLHGLLSL